MRLGLIVGVLVLVAVLGVGFFVAYKMLFPPESKETVTTTDSNKRADSPPAPPPMEAPKDGVAPAGSPAAGSPDSNASSQQTPAALPATDTSAASAVPSPDTAKAAAMQKAADAKAKAAVSAKSETPPASSPPTPASSPPRQAAAPAMAPAVQPDRWELMRQAYEVCSKESAFDRLGCNARVGQQYCKGYWGQVPQCPAGAYGDRANN